MRRGRRSRRPDSSGCRSQQHLDRASFVHPESVEIAGYSVVAEAVTNAVKHAAARELRIGIRRAGGTLRIELRDDGIGGATLGGGAGLRGIADRVDALVGAVGDANALLAVCSRVRPDVLVTDIRMPPGNTDDGLRAALTVRATMPGVGVMVLSQFVQRRYAIETDRH